MDIDTIAAGSDFVQEIDKALDSCDAMLVLIGRNWLEATDERGRRRIDDPNDFVRLEVERALQRDLRVIPLLVGGGILPDIADLPESMAPLLRRHAIDISDRRWVYDVRDLIGDLRRSPAQVRAAPRNRPAFSIQRIVREHRWLPLAATAVAAAVILALVVMPRLQATGGSPAAPTPAPPFTAATATALLLTSADIPSSADFPSTSISVMTGYAKYQIFDGEHSSCFGANVAVLGMDTVASAAFANNPPQPAGARTYSSYSVGNVVGHFTGSNALGFMDQLTLVASGCHVSSAVTGTATGMDESIRWTNDTSCRGCTPPIASGNESVWIRHGNLIAALYIGWDEHAIDPSFTDALVKAETAKLARQ